MTTTQNNTSLETTALIAQPLRSVLEVDLGVMTELGAKAKGASIQHINVPEELTGLPKSVPALIVRGDTPALKSISKELEEYRLFPARKSGTGQAQTLQSFIDLTMRHATDDSVIFADTNWKAPSLTAVIDYHRNEEAGAADNCKHRIHYAFPLSEEWNAWVAGNGKPMTQEEFALLIEDRIADLAAPSDEEIKNCDETFQTTVAAPSGLMLLSRGLQVNVSSQVKNAQTLQSGESQILFEETHETKSKDGGAIKVPGMFMLAVSPFFMGEVTRIPVRLRYRVSGGNIVWLYQLYRPDLAITERVIADVATVTEKTELPAFAGSPEIRV